MPTAYRLGPIKQAFITGRGNITRGETVMDEREVHDMVLRDGRLYVMTTDPVPHVIGSFPGNRVGPIVRDVPEVEDPADTVAGTGDDTVTG